MKWRMICICLAFSNVLVSMDRGLQASFDYEVRNFYPEKKYGGIPLCFWRTKSILNFGDHLSLKIVERILETDKLDVQHKRYPLQKGRKLLALGSIMSLASHNDVVWGTGVNGKTLDPKKYFFSKLDVRAVRGPRTRDFLREHFKIEVPEIYGDPALLLPYLFPELKKSEKPKRKYIVIPHYSEASFFSEEDETVVFPTYPWEKVVGAILESEFVISSSLHGVIVAEAFGIPAKLLKMTMNEPLFKYEDYYFGTGRRNFMPASTIEEALKMGGEPPFECDLKKLYEAFPFELWGKKAKEIGGLSR